MTDLETVLNGNTQAEPQEAEPTPAPETVEQPVEEPKGETQEPAEPADGEGEPPAPEHGKNVPLSALEAVRKERTDWKERAIRAEEQVKLREQEQQRQPQQPQQEQRQLSREEADMHRFFNISKMAAKAREPELDKYEAIVAGAIEKNPAIAQVMMSQADPYDWVIQEGKRLELLQSIGDDPSQYRAKLEAEIREQILAEQSLTAQPQAAPNPAAAVPPSLARARSNAPRNAVAWTGPTPLTDIVHRG